VHDADVERGTASGEYVVDTRLRDRLRALGFGRADALAADHGAGKAIGVWSSAQFAGEYSALREADLGLALGSRVDDIESRIMALERRPLLRLRSVFAGRR
jgi:hypothetical protein